MNIEDAQKIADQVIIAGLQGSLDNIRKVGGLRTRLTNQIRRDLPAEQIMENLKSTPLPFDVLKDALVSAMAGNS